MAVHPAAAASTCRNDSSSEQRVVAILACQETKGSQEAEGDINRQMAGFDDSPEKPVSDDVWALRTALARKHMDGNTLFSYMDVGNDHELVGPPS